MRKLMPVFFILVALAGLNAQAQAASPCSDDLIPFQDRNSSMWGYRDHSGRLVIPLHYDEAGYFCEGLAAVRVGSLWGFINKFADVVIEPRYREVKFFSEGAVAVVEDTKWYFIDAKGQAICPQQFLGAQHFSEGVASAVGLDAQGNLAWGFINHQCQWTIPPTLADVGPFTQSRAPFKKNGLWGFIDQTGTIKVSPIFLEVQPASENSIAVNYNNAYGFIDLDGHWLINPSLLDAKGFSEGLAAAAVLVSLPNDEVTARHSNEVQWGFLDTQGHWVIPPQFWTVEQSFHDGMARVHLTDSEQGYPPTTVPNEGEEVCINAKGAVLPRCP